MRLEREAARLQRRVTKTTERAVEAGYRPVLMGMVPAFMPSGYAPTLAGSLAIRTTSRRETVSVVVLAPTRGVKGRAVRKLEVGVLRHPLFGNRRRWYDQRVRAGFASVPLKAVKPLIIRYIERELAEVKRNVEKGGL